MNADPEIRAAARVDHNGIISLYRETFVEEDLVPLVNKLLAASYATSFVAPDEGGVLGHVSFTTCTITDFASPVALLGPLAVAPENQRRGLGSSLVKRGLENLNAKGITSVFVLGDPNYYSRLGFKPETVITPPYPIPAEWKPAWQSIANRDGQRMRTGQLVVPDPWRDQSLWSP